MVELEVEGEEEEGMSQEAQALCPASPIMLLRYPHATPHGGACPMCFWPLGSPARVLSVQP